MADWVRDNALMSMTTPLGGDKLIPTSVVADEGISRPFRYEISAVSQSGVIDPNQLLNQPICVTLRNANGPVRYFHGIAQQVRAEGTLRGATAGSEFQLYALTVVPRLWFLNQTVDCRVYQAKSAQDILTAMFQDAGLADFNFAVTSPATRPYTIQFNESDYTFAVRLMEQEGWFYYFEHTDSKHTLVVTDKNATFKDVPNATLHFTSNTTDPAGIFEWKPPVHTTTGSFAMGDYDPENPGTKLYNLTKTVLKTGGADARDVYQWPALTATNSIVEARAKFAVEAAEAATSLYHGTSHFGGLVPGGKFTLSNTTASPDDGAFALRSVYHIIEDASWITTDGNVSYQNVFEALKVATPWRQPLNTPRPRMEGVHSALVMGPQSDAKADIKMQSGEEIHTDDLARVKVRFYWDWRAEATGGASIWARVIQPWAGNGWGAQFIPRVGTEVAVAFVDGDPDRPIIIGGLYNGVSTPVYAVADKTKSGIRTRSTLSGSTSQFNELTFDDKSGSELIFIHAEKDLTTEVEHDELLTVDNCRVVVVKVDETITVKGKQTITVTKDHTFEVTQGNFTSTIDQGNYDLKVSTGNITVKVGAGAISMEAAQSITLKVGGSSIKVAPNGVTIMGPIIKIAGDSMVQIDGTITKASASGIMMIKGSLVKIN